MRNAVGDGHVHCGMHLVALHHSRGLALGAKPEMQGMRSMQLSVAKVSHFSYYQGPWPWQHFPPTEMADDETGYLVVVPVFLDWLEELRSAFGAPIILNDASRPPARQLLHSGRTTGSHVDGMGADARVHGEDAERLERIAIAKGVLGRGVYQNGKTPLRKRFLHLDLWANAPPGLRPRLWSG